MLTIINNLLGFCIYHNFVNMKILKYQVIHVPSTINDTNLRVLNKQFLSYK